MQEWLQLEAETTFLRFNFKNKDFLQNIPSLKYPVHYHSSALKDFKSKIKKKKKDDCSNIDKRMLWNETSQL